jgi:D-sedoheptulose 7-phosphate isomerase
MKKNNQYFEEILESLEIKKKLIELNREVFIAIKRIFSTIKKGGKVFICGNGGSAADAQHLSAEFLVRLNPNKNRRPLPIISLAMDTSTITACGNDYGFQYIFSRNLQALASKKDLLIVISTSGNSKNIIEVLKLSKKMKIFSIAFLGCGGGSAKKLSNLNLLVPHSNVARIQESHIFIGHFILGRVEEMLFYNKKIRSRKKNS